MPQAATNQLGNGQPARARIFRRATMDRVVQQNASLVEEATAASHSMSDQAGALLQLVSRFRLVAVKATTAGAINVSKFAGIGKWKEA